MMDKLKSVLLAALVMVSMIQSYFLAYNMPNMKAKVNTEQDYVKTEPLGAEEDAKNLIFPEMLVLHMGGDKHTVFYPNKTFYKEILGKLQGREFKGFQRDSVGVVDWNEVRREDNGIELRFGRPVPFDLLRKVFKIDGDFLFSRDSVDRIWIFSRADREEVRTFFFSADGRSVYESLRADLTVGDVTQVVGFGQYGLSYSTGDGEVYIPDKPYDGVPQMQVPITRFTPEQMQRNLFFDAAITRTAQGNQEDTQIYTDGKKLLLVGQNGGWMGYSDPAAPADAVNDLVDNFMAAVQFVNQHGGWNGTYRLTQAPVPDTLNGATSEDNVIRFQQYYGKVPLVSSGSMTFGYMQLTMQQGAVSSYERSLLQLDMNTQTNKKVRLLPGGNDLRQLINRAAGGERIEALYPAYRPSEAKDVITLYPVWVIRLASGEERIVTESGPVQTKTNP
ncbi:YycH family regulatory protein [Cohnella faecalis]|uniref:Regulatory protein YycH domain-containing protein n=1 Tax=Cohnella faecalis TaxID=2315694 RepID=A0A398CKS5_9BACL|nr:two-component system activity regulator YycH [Cohnella faecalis]RIE01478.1 hypothetical protein D3H35_24295 [Cohnella faecalis]